MCLPLEIAAPPDGGSQLVRFVPFWLKRPGILTFICSISLLMVAAVRYWNFKSTCTAQVIPVTKINVTTLLKSVMITNLSENIEPSFIG